MKIRIAYAVLAACVSVSSVALGQTPQTKHLSGSDANTASWTPDDQANAEQEALIIHDAVTDQHSGNYVQAEAEARQAMTLVADGRAYEVLAQALDAQGKTQEALQAYHNPAIISDGEHGPEGHPRNLLPYALLLLKSRQWTQALAAYNQAVAQFSESNSNLDPVKINFSVGTPEPAALETALHIEYGRMLSAGTDWAGEPQNREAFAEYGKALQLAPDSDVVNYYYGVGWQKLSPAEQKQFGSAQQAKAALQKAVRLGRGPVKKAAQKALQVAMKTK